MRDALRATPARRMRAYQDSRSMSLLQPAAQQRDRDGPLGRERMPVQRGQRANERRHVAAAVRQQVLDDIVRQRESRAPWRTPPARRACRRRRAASSRRPGPSPTACAGLRAACSAASGTRLATSRWPPRSRSPLKIVKRRACASGVRAVDAVDRDEVARSARRRDRTRAAPPARRRTSRAGRALRPPQRPHATGASCRRPARPRASRPSRRPCPPQAP